MLILVRHAMPAYTPDVPAHEWHLAEEGRMAAARLATLLPDNGYLVASSEPKAGQTLEPAGTVVRDPRFDEVYRTEPWEGDYRERRLAYVDGTDHAGWEPRSAVAGRFDAGIAEHTRAAAGRPLVVASHGMAMTLWLTARGCLHDPAVFWAGLAFPDAHVVDLARATVTRLTTWEPAGG
jgi:broad specificity phosphatase PhoE